MTFFVAFLQVFVGISFVETLLQIFLRIIPEDKKLWTNASRQRECNYCIHNAKSVAYFQGSPRIQDHPPEPRNIDLKKN